MNPSSGEAWSLRAALMLSGLLSGGSGSGAEAAGAASADGGAPVSPPPPPVTPGAPDIADLPPEDLHEAKRCLEMSLGLWREPTQVRDSERPWSGSASKQTLLMCYRWAMRGCSAARPPRRRSLRARTRAGRVLAAACRAPQPARRPPDGGYCFGQRRRRRFACGRRVRPRASVPVARDAASAGAVGRQILWLTRM